MKNIHRRGVISGLAAVSLLPAAVRAEDFTDITWEDLLPATDTAMPTSLRGLLPHDESAPLTNDQPVSSGVRPDWNGQIVRLGGFIVPIDQSAAGVTAFILVPYVGACIHVPPPPANQLVFVTTSTPYDSSGLFEPVSVTGMFGVSSLSTQLAEIGYALSADKIEPYST